MFQLKRAQKRCAGDSLMMEQEEEKKQRTKSTPTTTANVLSSFRVILTIFIVLSSFAPTISRAFHLSLGHKLMLGARDARSAAAANQAQLNPASTLIRPIECRNANNHTEAGICMFSIDCMQNKGTPLSICKHNYFVGTCCKLPDHNNFVGIVYDLRETEAAQAAAAAAALAAVQLVGRQETPGPSESQPALAGQTFSLDSATTMATTGPRDTNQPATGRAQVAASSSASELPLTTRTMQEFGGREAQHSVAASLDQKYIISSTSLFQSSTSSMRPPGLVPVAESARNADGQATGPTLAGQQTNGSSSVVSNERPNLAQDETNKTMSIAYELIREEMAQKAVEQQQQQQQLAVASNQSESQTVLSSAHSAPVVDERHKPTMVVFANNHQPSAPPNAGPQEFSLASAPPISGQDLTRASEIPSAIPTKATIATVAPSNSSTNDSTEAERPSSGESSPFYDLISSPASRLAGSPISNGDSLLQTTTPFTSSLSTALLPQVGAHSFVATSPAPLELSNSSSSSSSSGQKLEASSSQLSQSTLPASTQPATTTTTTTTTTLVSQQVNATSGGGGGSSGNQLKAQSPLSLPSQLYSNQHTGSAGRPLLGALQLGPGSGAPLQATSKIVAGSGSAANNLLPGLSGLQSAILSHIPFKIASGLSLGLSSYLQAAMKPTVGGAFHQGPPSRPLISSNTAPAAQFQAQSGTAAASTNLTSSPTRTPSSSTTSSSSTTTSTLGGSSALNSTAYSGVQFKFEAPHTAGAAGLAGFVQADILRDARQVCGRPQVPAGGELVAGARKRVARIVGGNQSLFGQWPWMVSLRQWRKGAFLHKCGAALLNENWAITAAHCVEK